MRTCAKLALSALLSVVCLQFVHGQDLAPRAYVITPVRSNAITVTWSRFNGSVNFNGTVPVSDARGTYYVPVLTYSRSFGFFGRSARISASQAYAFGHFKGDLNGVPQSLYRSGLLDTSLRFSVNLKGGPAMSAREFVQWKQKTLIGVSLKVVFPTGQYDPTKLVSWGINRWAFKPEVGLSRRWEHWVLDAYGGVWFYTDNPASFSGLTPKPQSEAPIGSFEGHLSYDFSKLGCWASLDGNLWFGGTATLGGIEIPQTRQISSRIGATVSLPLTKHHSIKAAYSVGTYVRYGGDYRNLQVAWQYSWLDSPR